LRKELDKMQDIKELHIHVDLLKNTEAGVDLMREKYGKAFLLYSDCFDGKCISVKLLYRLELERSVYNDLSDEYFKLEGKIKSKKSEKS
jgi:hypothetical protein